MAYNASDGYLRQKYPRRFSLKNKLRRLVARHPRLALWDTESGSTMCGFASSRQTEAADRGGMSLSQRAAEISDYLRDKLPAAPLDPADQIAAICELAEGPVEIDELVTVMAEFWGVRDTPLQSYDDAGGSRSLNGLTDPGQRFDVMLDHRARIEQVWDEVLQLPVRQRAALLLNLRDSQGGSAVAMLPILRIATIEQIAEALEMTDEELALLWNDLPVEDAVIGKRLGATRQQVSNLRKCARERLSRRLAAKDES